MIQLRGFLRRALRLDPPAPVFPGRIPDFFVVGAARSGTTSMWQYLRQHPQLFLPAEFADKEPSFFCSGYGLRNPGKYCALFAEARPEQLIGECSTPYLTSPESARRIRQSVPEARIVIILRNPADRAASLHGWMHEHGYESIARFEDALAAEATRQRDPHFRRNHGQYFYNFLYYHSGLYARQVKRYFRVFGRERVQVQIFEEMLAAPAEAVRRVFSFLGVDPNFDPVIEIHNARSEPQPHPGPMRAELLSRYRADIAALSRVLGRDLSACWR